MAWNAAPASYFLRHSSQCIDNATEIYNILAGTYTWDIYAVCSVLANIWRESTFNPWLWEGRTVRSTSDYRNFTGGYGLVQWTPYPPTPFPNTQPYVDSPIAQGYIGYSPNFSDRPGTALDGQAQTNFIPTDMFAAGNYFPCSISYYYNAMMAVGVDITTFRNMSKYDFADGTGTPYTPTAYIGVFALNYLRPDKNEVSRRFTEMLDEFNYWYIYFSGQPPVPPPTPINIPAIWFTRNKRMKGGWIYGI